MYPNIPPIICFWIIVHHTWLAWQTPSHCIIKFGVIATTLLKVFLVPIPSTYLNGRSMTSSNDLWVHQISSNSCNCPGGTPQRVDLVLSTNHPSHAVSATSHDKIKRRMDLQIQQHARDSSASPCCIPGPNLPYIMSHTNLSTTFT